MSGQQGVSTGRIGAAPMIDMFRALGDPTRLRIWEFLRDCCCPVAVDDNGEVRPAVGLTVGEVCCHVSGDPEARITSTISEHLRELRMAGLIRTEKRGRHVLCSANPDAINALAAYFGGLGTAVSDFPSPNTAACCTAEGECC